MRISNQCSIATHVMIVLAIFRGRKLTSSQIAQSVGCDPVMVRNSLGKLKKAGLVETFRGSGGSEITKEPEIISLWDIYSATDDLDNLMGLHPNPYEECPIGRNIYAVLEVPYERIKQAIRREMEQIYLSELIQSCADHEGCSLDDFIETCLSLL